MASYASPLPLPTFFAVSTPVLISSNISLKLYPSPLKRLFVRRRRRLKTPAACSAEAASKLEQWDSMTARFAGASNIPFLLIQIPQILLNQRNLVSNNSAALFAVPWLGMLTGLLGNLTLLSYFAKKKEKEAILVQILGVISIYIVIVQLAVVGAMPLPQFMATSAAVVTGLVLNFMNYYGWLIQWVWQRWEDFVTIVGISVLPQVMWSTFVPFIPNSIFPGVVSCCLAVLFIILTRTGKLSKKAERFVGSISGWTATLLFMWMPVAQMWTNYLNPDNIKGLAALTLLLGMIGNGLMIPRALFIRDLMWFTGASWASLLQGWGNLAWMYCLKSISKEFFWAATVVLLIWLGMAARQDRIAYGYSSPFQSMKVLFFGTR
ncbi:maltose excess protein 1-like, chloroplastic [Dendrobium catenatum]|uniref:Maltose excess protein 1-like, chloroplastic n=1 Tax=Dendrobium catenatum TaxID=906689 RepID=A0A2I0WIA8_9ASPA|nr:maltose excess protein 1-like, chloroplastic [Dendrobium catenatum]PKU75389.1 Maltose excess protein 1-like, chloroplastic [Dendrobium catenatum]